MQCIQSYKHVFDMYIYIYVSAHTYIYIIYTLYFMEYDGG